MCGVRCFCDVVEFGWCWFCVFFLVVLLVWSFVPLCLCFCLLACLLWLVFFRGWMRSDEVTMSKSQGMGSNGIDNIKLPMNQLRRLTKSKECRNMEDMTIHATALIWLPWHLISLIQSNCLTLTQPSISTCTSTYSLFPKYCSLARGSGKISDLPN